MPVSARSFVSSKSLVTLAAFFVFILASNRFAFGGNTDDTTREQWLKSFRRSCLRPQARISS